MKHSDYKIRTFDQEQLVIREFTSEGKPKQALVFVHGLGGDKEAWEICIEKFRTLDADKKYCEITYDLRGHGSSTRKIYPDLPIYKSNAADLKSVIETLAGRTDIDSIALIGHSFGSFIAQQYAHDFLHPKVKKLVLISGPATARGIRVPTLLRKFFLLLPTWQIIHRTKSDYKKYIGSGDFDIQRIVSDIRSVGLSKYMTLESMLVGTKVSGRTKKIEIPVYVLCGEKDSYFTLGNMEKFQKEIRAKEFIIFHDTNHIVPINRAEELAQALFSVMEDV